jgi:exodeoxyribonuclease VII small subunit
MTPKSDKLPDFEQSLVALEELVRKLESGTLSLDQSLAEFRKGVELTRHCQSVLERAQQTVEQLLDVDDENSATAFNPDA